MRRRKIVKLGFLLGTTALPSQWLKPIVNTVVLPAHAQTSCVLQIDPTQPIAIATIHWIGESTISVGTANKVKIDITLLSSTAVFSLTLSSGSTISSAAVAINCDGSFSPVQVINGGEIYAISGQVTRVDFSNYIISTTIDVTGTITGSQSIDIHATITLGPP